MWNGPSHGFLRASVVAVAGVAAAAALGAVASTAPDAVAPSGDSRPLPQEGPAVESPRSAALPASPHAAVGSTACRVCHRAIFRAWSDGPHAGAGEALSRPDAGESCADCHAPLAATEDGVGCESCHGPGAAYSDLAVMIDPLKRRAAGLWDAAATCSGCHNPGHPFHVERDLAALAASIHPAPPYRTAE